MKKVTTAAAVLAAMAMMSVSAFADSVYVTITNDKGEIVAAQNKIEVTDTDGDGALTINDALYNAHEELFDGGAAAGFGSGTGDYGLYLTKLWGIENGGSYGYYLNNAAAMGLTDPVKDGDYLNAFVYTDTTAFSDKYCYFDVNNVTLDSVDAEFTLYAATYDENWAPITVPVAGATIIIDGKKTDFVTDADGKVNVTFPKANYNYLMTAVSDTEILVPPVCEVNVEAPAEEDETGVSNTEPADIAAPATGDVAAATDSSKGSPDTGIEDIAVIAGLALIAGGVIAVTRRK